MSTPDYDGFLEYTATVKDQFLKKLEHEKTIVFIITHHDADGISAGSIMTSALKRQQIPFQARVVKQISSKYIGDITGTFRGETAENCLTGPDSECPDKFFVFTDFGSGQLDFLAKSVDRSRVLILDHHEIEEVKDETVLSGMLHVNPWLFGINGSMEISGAGVAYLFAKAMNPDNKDLAPLAIMGALGDMQDKGDKTSLTGLNRVVVEDAKNMGLISESLDLKVFGRYSRPIHLALSFTMDPFLPGLSGDETACANFVQRLQIPVKHPGTEKSRTIADMTPDEKSKFVSALIEWSMQHGMAAATIKGLVGNIYVLENEDPSTNLKDLREFASMLNSCGRQGYGGIGIAIAMGDRGEIFAEGQHVIGEYRKKISNYMDWIHTTNAIKKRDNLQVLEGAAYIDDAMIGTLVSMLLNSRSVGTDSPVVGWAFIKDDPDAVKISARAVQSLVDRGLNLGTAIRDVLKELNIDSPGGGHAPAAGVEIPKAKLDKFLRALGKRTVTQLQASGSSTQAPKKTQSWI
ncbi:MAG TPA: DHH family phosphoesterase [Candidatus Lokiarchaeia archaeon]|nr:DHH family phosphoesterase [Candidatus Lokiarchaeia archaeon]